MDPRNNDRPIELTLKQQFARCWVPQLPLKLDNIWNLSKYLEGSIQGYALKWTNADLHSQRGAWAVVKCNVPPKSVFEQKRLKKVQRERIPAGEPEQTDRRKNVSCFALFFCQTWTSYGGFSQYFFLAFSNHWRKKQKTTPPPSHPMFPHMLAHHHATQWLMLPPFISVVGSLFCIWMMRWHLCLFLLLTHTRLSVGTQKRVASICGNLLHSILSWGKLSGSENAHLSVYEMLMWVATAWLCWRALKASLCTKSHLLCVF